MKRAAASSPPWPSPCPPWLIAALFAPLRRRVQAAIDRRFFRQKYNAQQVLAQFAHSARDEVEMEVLQAELLRVVQETLQPEQIAIWLKPFAATLCRIHPAYAGITDQFWLHLYLF